MAPLSPRSSRLVPLRWLLPVFVLLAACRHPAKPVTTDDAQPRRRVFKPPPGEVRAVPPLAIRSQGVGPYLLGAPLPSVLSSLPHGPHVELLQLQGMLDYSLVRTEGQALVIGVQRFDGVTFVAVLDREIARTQSGVGVGTPVADLDAALGAPRPLVHTVRDPRVREFASLPNTLFLTDGTKVTAVLVRRPQGDAGSAGGAAAARLRHHGGPRCRVPQALRHAEAEVRTAARLVDFSSVRVRFGCVASGKPAALVSSGDHVAVVEGSPGKLRRSAAEVIPGLLYAAPLDIDGDGKQEIIAVSERVQNRVRAAEVEILRDAGGHLTTVAKETPYKLSAQWAAWIGATLEDTDFLIQVRAHAGALEVGGLYVQRAGGRTRNVAPLLPQTWTMRAARAGGPHGGAPADAGDRDAQTGWPLVSPRAGGRAKRHGSGGKANAAAARGAHKPRRGGKEAAGAAARRHRRGKSDSGRTKRTKARRRRADTATKAAAERRGKTKGRAATGAGGRPARARHHRDAAPGSSQ